MTGMGFPGDRLIGRLRRIFGRPSPEAHDAPVEAPSPERLDRAVADTAGGSSDAAHGLASMLLVIGRDDDLVAHATRLLAEAPLPMWLTLDASARRWNAPQWTEVAARRLAAGGAGLFDLALAACHANGHVRQAAVTALGARDDVLGLLAVRAVDWVPQVRDRARLVCGRWFARAPVRAVTVLAPAALALRGRREGQWLADAVETTLRTGPPEAAAAALASGDRRLRRLAHTTALDTGRLDLDHLTRTALTDADMPIRVLCADAAIRAAGRTGDRAVPRRLLASGTAAVRAEAVRALAAAGELGPATAALTDRSALVRATAQAAVRRAGTDPATHYRAVLADQRPPLPWAIAGLGETGARPDTALLRPWLDHPSSRGRAEAIRALRRLGDTPRRPLLTLLEDPVSAVARQAVLSLLPGADTLDEHALRPLLRPPHPPHVHWAAYRLLRARDTWTRLSVDLELATDPGHPVHANARADLTAWLRHDAATTYSTPSADRAAELSGLLAAAEAVLGPETTRVLRFHFGLAD